MFENKCVSIEYEVWYQTFQLPPRATTQSANSTAFFSNSVRKTMKNKHSTFLSALKPHPLRILVL